MVSRKGAKGKFKSKKQKNISYNFLYTITPGSN